MIWAEAAEAVDHTTARIIQEVIHIQAVQDLLTDLQAAQDLQADLPTDLQVRLRITPEAALIRAAAVVTAADAAMRVVSAAA